MDGTSINARNWGAPPFCLFLCCKMGCLWQGFPEMMAEESNAGQDEEKG